MALEKLKKWIGTQAMTAFFDQLNDNVDATNAAIDLAEQNAATIASLPAGGEEYTLTLQNGWLGTLTYRKNGLGQVHIKGNITSPSSVDNRQLIATLPSGYRPSQNLAFNAYNAFAGRILLMGRISPSGNIALEHSIASEGQEVAASQSYMINLIYDTR